MDELRKRLEKIRRVVVDKSLSDEQAYRELDGIHEELKVMLEKLRELQRKTHEVVESNERLRELDSIYSIDTEFNEAIEKLDDVAYFVFEMALELVADEEEEI